MSLAFDDLTLRASPKKTRHEKNRSGLDTQGCWLGVLKSLLFTGENTIQGEVEPIAAKEPAGSAIRNPDMAFKSQGINALPVFFRLA
jgi:hypothetical protein